MQPIEILQQDLCDIPVMCSVEEYADCSKQDGSCVKCRQTAKRLYKEGYRKQSDVVNEIIGSIKRYTLGNDDLTDEQVSEMWEFLERLKKLYGVKDDGV